MQRKRIMDWWWGWLPNECTLWIQNVFGRVLCWRYGHERGRSRFCDWCGKDMSHASRA